MLELSFNELSTLSNAESKGHALSIYKEFMSVVDEIQNLKIAPVRIRTCIDLSNYSISSEGAYFTLKDWLKTLNSEDRQRYLGYIAQESFLIEESYYYFNEVEAKGFGYAHLNDLISISYNNQGSWGNDSYKVMRITQKEIEEDAEIDEVTVYHCSYNNGNVSHAKWLEETFKLKQAKILEGIHDIDDFLIKTSNLFKYLDFGTEVSNQIKGFESLNNSELKKAISYLLRLDKHLEKVNLGRDTFDNYPGDVSNDGEATLKKYGEERKLPTHEGKIFQYSLHAKLGGNLRIYMKPLEETSRVIIGYIGSHMRTKKFSK
ncbi:hypothetical protein [Flavobacterium panici]|uniref:Uncharacterized protein n=1 Tax=Flavobacterium panici TaxID=2654843 RepID=A0A9N8J1P4_9FLAO|nr:hypothetical protein [Flavobacterium panici]CAC9973829.1 hypothetical protein FLAPXU55_01518 [Flavobacterium panici]